MRSPATAAAGLLQYQRTVSKEKAMGNGNKSSSSAKKKAGKGHSLQAMTEEPSSGVKDILQTSNLEEVKDRQGGDGESLPHTPPNEPVHMLLQPLPKDREDSSPFLIHIRVDALALLLFVISLVTRLYRLDQPKNVV